MQQGYTSDESIQQPRRRERRVDRVSWAWNISLNSTCVYFFSSNWNTIRELGHVNTVNNKLGSLSARHLSTVCKISLRITKERRTIRLASRRCILPSMWEGNRRKPTKRPAAPTQEKMVAKFWTQDIASFLDSFRTHSFSPETEIFNDNIKLANWKPFSMEHSPKV